MQQGEERIQTKTDKSEQLLTLFRFYPGLPLSYPLIFSASGARNARHKRRKQGSKRLFSDLHRLAFCKDFTMLLLLFLFFFAYRVPHKREAINIR